MGRMTAKGTQYENDACEILRPAFPDVHRREKHGANDKGDLRNLGWWELGEAKKWDRWNVPLWIRKVKKKIESNRWFIIFAGDRRKSWMEDFVLMPASAFVERERLIRGYEMLLEEYERKAG